MKEWVVVLQSEDSNRKKSIGIPLCDKVDGVCLWKQVVEKSIIDCLKDGKNYNTSNGFITFGYFCTCDQDLEETKSLFTSMLVLLTVGEIPESSFTQLITYRNGFQELGPKQFKPLVSLMFHELYEVRFKGQYELYQMIYKDAQNIVEKHNKSFLLLPKLGMSSHGPA